MTSKKKIQSFFNSWYNGIPFAKAVLLHGPPGVGKTSMVYAYQNKYEYRIIHYNASTMMSSEFKDIDNITQREDTVDGVKNVMLLDEVDGCKNWDVLKETIKISRIPIIMTVNWISEVPKLNDVMFVELTFPRLAQKIKIMEHACKQRGLKVSEDRLTRIAETCKTHRGCILTLQKCVLNNTWRKIERPYEDMSPEDELLGIYNGTVSDSDWVIDKFLDYSLINGVNYKDLGDLKYLDTISREASLEDIPYDFMHLCRSDVKMLKRPSWKYYKRKYIGRKKQVEKVEFKTTKERKVVVRKFVKEQDTVDEIWKD